MEFMENQCYSVGNKKKPEEIRNRAVKGSKNMEKRSIRIGVDVGGTNTDICAIDEANGELMVYKLPSSLGDQSEAVVKGILVIAEEYGFTGEEVSRFMHGTTAATNAILEGRGAKTALITTGGFRDLLEIGRQKRPDLYDLQADKPLTLVPRDRRYELGERMNYRGEVVRPLNEEEVLALAEKLKEEKTEAAAVMLLNAYLNSENEERVRDLLEEKCPGLFLTISSDLSRQFREYERLCGTVLNSFVGPEVRKYMNNLKQTLAKIGIRNTYINHSNGGLMSLDETMRFPVKTALSGPAAGVVGAQYVSELAGEKNLITIDIGGTSTDISLVADGRIEGSDEKTISGYPVRIPSIDISTIGAGGGSIAWIDSGGILKVGPQSAGAFPGPACYNLGGENATITDARVVLGHLNGEALLGGRLPIRKDLSIAAVGRLAKKLGMGLEETARGILAVSNSNIIREMKNVTVAKGYNPSDFCLVAFGGSGPLHAAELMEEMNIQKVLVPSRPGLLAAYGLLTENMRRDFVQTDVMDLSEETAGTLARRFRLLEGDAEKWFGEENIALESRRREYFLDMRYKGQNHEIRVPITEDAIGNVQALSDAFTAAYRRLYSFSTDDTVQIVNFGLSAIGDIVYPKLTEEEPGSQDASDAVIGSRSVWEDGQFTDYTLYDRAKLHAGNVIPGPAIVEQMDSTTVILPGQKAAVDRYQNMLIERNGEEA